MRKGRELLDQADRISDATLSLALPDGGYLAEYMEYACGVTMAPPEYHLACGLTQMAALLGNRFTFVLGGKQYPAHLWIVLLGPAGVKKTSAIDLAGDMLDEATDKALRLPRETSREKLLEILSRRPTGCWRQGEFVAFLGRASRDYNAGLKEDLCEVWDSPVTMEKALKSGTTVINKPAVSILGGAVTQALGDWVRHRDLEGGFLSRFLFVPNSSSTTYMSMIDHFTPKRVSLTEDLRAIWRELPPSTQRVVFPPESLTRWEEYDKEMLEIDVPLELTGFQGRLGTYAAKTAMCYALAETGSPVPRPDHVDLACAFVEYTRRHVWTLVGDLDSGRDAQDLRRLKASIKHLSNGEDWVSLRNISLRMHLVRRRLMELLQTLADEDTIEMRIAKPSNGGKPRTEVRLVTGGKS